MQIAYLENTAYIKLNIFLSIRLRDSDLDQFQTLKIYWSALLSDHKKYKVSLPILLCAWRLEIEKERLNDG